MNVTVDFRLGDLIRAVMAEHEDEPNPHAIAEAVAERIPDAVLRDVVRSLLPAAVRTHIGRQRHAPPASNGSNTSSRWDEVSALSNDIRVWRVALGDDDWKFLGDLTAGDARSVAANYQLLADANQTRAKQYEYLAQTMEHHAAARAGDLPDEVLSEVFGV